MPEDRIWPVAALLFNMEMNTTKSRALCRPGHNECVVVFKGFFLLLV